MVSASDFKNGLTVEIDGDIFQVIDFQHVKPGKGAAFVRSKLKSVTGGGILERSFRPNDRMQRAHIDRKDMQYLYSDGELYHFMDTENYEQTAISAEVVGDALKFVKENENVKIMMHDATVLGIEPPLVVELLITETEPGFKGDTATGATKPATLETGAVVQVPLFISNGEIVKVDTRTGEYTGRVQ